MRELLLKAGQHDQQVLESPRLTQHYSFALADAHFRHAATLAYALRRHVVSELCLGSLHTLHS